MPLNYSKWDKLELSDDSDIEGHPNVDHKSLVRWKQRDIHEKREVRKAKIAHLRAQIACNEVIRPRITKLHEDLQSASSPQSFLNSLAEKLEKNPSKECPPGNDPSKPEQTYDGMVLALIRQVIAESKQKTADSSIPDSEKSDKVAKAVVDGVKFHVGKLQETIEEDKKSLEEEIEEQQRHITSDDVHDGFSSKYVPGPEEPKAVPTTSIKKKSKETKKVTEYETLNPGAAGASSGTPVSDDEDEEGLPELTPALEGFSRIPLRRYEESYQYIQKHRDVVVGGASDALLVTAFTAQGKGQSKYAKQCIHQSLLLQYGEKLGKDGLGVFFKKMMAGDQRAEKVFLDDLESTYAHLVQRVEITMKEEAEAEGREQIQLVAENPDQKIEFVIPDGPPPENIVFEGPGTEDLDIEEARKALQFRWDVFDSFSEDLKAALKSGSLAKVNVVLGDLTVEEAEQVVESLSMTGMLSFSESGIRDDTPAGKAARGEGVV